ncbi:MAG: hypothetical protein WCT29_03120 [Candidatus Paceibacterota bacterium]|jgi:hypothetical protein
MKKYIALFLVLFMALVFNTKVIFAESGKGGDGSGDRTEIESEDGEEVEDEEKVEDEDSSDNGDSDLEEDANDDLNDDSDDDSALKTEREKAREEFKLRTETLKKEMELKRETLRKEFEVRREEAKQKMEGLREQLKKEKDAAKAKIGGERVLGREQALERFDGAVERMLGLKEKVDAVIARLEAKEVNTVKAKEFSTTAETKIKAAKEKVLETTTLLTTSLDQLTAENKTQLRTLAQETQTLLTDARLALRDAVKSLKDEVKAKIEAEKPAEADDDSNDTEN